MTSSLCYPYGKAEVTGRLKTFAADFTVDEELGFEPTGEGEHLFLQIEKVGLTTRELIERVATDFSINARDIGYSGLKDKIAVSRQWLSLHLPGQVNVISMPIPDGYIILNQVWHNKKLRPGSHSSNRFEVLLRDVSGMNDVTCRQIESIRRLGMANYFGQQRFGSGSDNVRQALRVFANARKARKLSRNRKSLYLSALRSELFNQILSKRIEANIWQEPVEGDCFMLAGSRSVFQETLDEEIFTRYREFDISSTASLYGIGANMHGDRALEIEKQVYRDNPEICRYLSEQNVSRQMRAIRVDVKEFTFDYDADKKLLKVRAILPRGCFFTTLLDHFVDTFLGYP